MRKVIAFMLVCAMTAGLAACGGSSSGSSGRTSGSSGESGSAGASAAASGTAPAAAQTPVVYYYTRGTETRTNGRTEAVSISYDAWGNRLEMIYEGASSTTLYTYEYEYYEDGTVRSQTWTVSSIPSDGGIQRETRYYDEHRNILSYSYETNRSPSSASTKFGPLFPDFRREYEYDGDGELRSFTEYDADGQVYRRAESEPYDDPAGARLYRIYDAGGDQVAESVVYNTGGKSDSYRYSGEYESSYVAEYDDFGRLIHSRSESGGGSSISEFYYTYDGDGRCLSQESYYNGELTARYEYSEWISEEKLRENGGTGELAVPSAPGADDSEDIYYDIIDGSDAFGEPTGISFANMDEGTFSTLEVTTQFAGYWELDGGAAGEFRAMRMDTDGYAYVTTSDGVSHEGLWWIREGSGHRCVWFSLRQEGGGTRLYAFTYDIHTMALTLYAVDSQGMPSPSGIAYRRTRLDMTPFTAYTGAEQLSAEALGPILHGKWLCFDPDLNTGMFPPVFIFSPHYNREYDEATFYEAYFENLGDWIYCVAGNGEIVFSHDSPIGWSTMSFRIEGDTMIVSQNYFTGSFTDVGSAEATYVKITPYAYTWQNF